MDFMTIIGLLGGAATVYYVMSTGEIVHMLFNTVAFVLVFFGTLFATFVAYPFEIIKNAVIAMKLLFIPPKNTGQSREELIEQIANLAEKARRQNIESLQSDVSDMKNKFLSHGLQMVIDGMDAEVVRDNLERDILYSRQQRLKVCSVFRTMATLAPIFGLLGTLIGVVEVLKNLQDPTNLGTGMAVAITTTFYGIFLANFLFLPLSIKLNDHYEDDIISSELITEGILSIQNSELPLVIRKKLNAFVKSYLLQQSESAKE